MNFTYNIVEFFVILRRLVKEKQLTSAESLAAETENFLEF